jgi:hypothetical protein
MAIASLRGMPSQKNVGIMIKAAPTPATVSTVVKTKTKRDAMIIVVISLSHSPNKGYTPAFRL